MDWTALPPLSALRAFAAYADRGSVAEAGRALNVSHAAISQQIRNLEAHMASPCSTGTVAGCGSAPRASGWPRR